MALRQYIRKTKKQDIEVLHTYEGKDILAHEIKGHFKVTQYEKPLRFLFVELEAPSLDV